MKNNAKSAGNFWKDFPPEESHEEKGFLYFFFLLLSFLVGMLSYRDMILRAMAAILQI